MALDQKQVETAAKYDVLKVESVMLELVTDLHPKHISAGRLLRKIVSDITDAKEVETGSRAIHNLREFGLFSLGDDGTVEPTPAALHAAKLFTWPNCL